MPTARRRRRRWAGVVAAVALAAGGYLMASLAAAAPVRAGEPAPQLRREGRWMVDHHGRVVLLHGVNAIWKVPPYVPPDSPEGFTAADADWLVDHGFNTVRIGTLFVGVMPEAGEIDDDYLDAWDRVVQLLAERGIWVMFDFHQDMYNERFSGEGFPDWATHDDGIPMVGDFGFPGNYFQPATMRAFDHFWADDFGLWDHYRDAWEAVADRWAGQPYHMGYDLMNEPWPGTDWPTCANPAGCPVFDTSELEPAWEHMLAGIRGHDPGNLVWYEPNVIFNSGAKSNLGPVADPNVGFSFHDYCLLAAALHAQGATDVPGCPEQHRIVWDNHVEARDRMGVTALLTEFGASDDIPDIEEVAALADEYLTGWQYWHYKEWKDPTTESQESGGQGLFEDDTDLSTLKPDKADVLVRTYPQATAGVPLSLDFDTGDGDFRYVYEPRAATAPTEIYVSNRHYPDGYTVEVSGADVTSEPGARVVTLADRPGADEVTVVIRRGPGGDAGPAGPGGAGAGGSGGTGAGLSAAGGGGLARSGRLPATGGPAWPALGAAALLASAVTVRRLVRP